jgi:hypothetical protein
VAKKEYLSYGYGVSRHFQQYFSYIVVVSLLVEGAEEPEENHRPWPSSL